MDSSPLSAKDEKILLVILQTIGNHPDELEYKRLNVKKLSNILNNSALSLDLLVKFGFKYAPNKSQLIFDGVPQYIAHEDEVIVLLHARKLSWILVRAAIRACFRADIDTREVFDSDTTPSGVFITMESDLRQNNNGFYTPWENRMLSYKTQTTLRAKEMCNLKRFEDLFVMAFGGKCRYTKEFKKFQMYVFNNQGYHFQGIDWDGMDIDKLIYNFYRKHGHIHQLIAKFPQIYSVFLSTTDKDENKRNFFKKCVFFLYSRLHCHAHDQPARCYVQYNHYKLISTLNKYKYLLNKLSNIYQKQIQTIMIMNGNQWRDDVIEQHMDNIVKPMVERIEKSKKICKYVKNSMLSKGDNSVDYVWKCLLCNTKHNYNFGDCSNCTQNEWNELYSMCPLYYVQKNQSITFGIDPRVKPFYMIWNNDGKGYDCNTYRYIQAMMENNHHLKLSTIVITHHHGDNVSIVILFEKSNPLTLYDLKHILFEIYLSAQYGEKRAKMWTFGDVRFEDPDDPNILNKLSDDNIIDMNEPCYVDLNRLTFGTKVRTPVEFDKPRFDKGYYHSCYNIDNINLNIKNNNISDNNYNKVQDKQRVIKPIEISDVTEMFHFEHSSSRESASHTREEMNRLISDRSRMLPRINALLHLIKEVINNGYENDLLPVREIDDNDYTSIDMIDAIVYEYEMKTNTSISNRKNEAFANYGIFNKFDMGLIKELSKVYKIFDKHHLQSKMNHKRHKMIGYPLCCFEMLALMLYCEGNCNYDLSKSQRSNTAMKKWPYFHCMLDMAIRTLSPFEIHYEHIYTGICGVFLEINVNQTEASLQTTVSFSTDLNVALQFRGDSGMVIGMNMKRIVKDFEACDVSWISPHPDEKEILCRVGSRIRIYPNLVRKIGNTQWIVFVEDELDHDKAFKSIFGTLTD